MKTKPSKKSKVATKRKLGERLENRMDSLEAQVRGLREIFGVIQSDMYQAGLREQARIDALRPVDDYIKALRGALGQLNGS